jgi:chlorinating enzyme
MSEAAAIGNHLALYERQGFVGPIKAFEPEELQEMAQEIFRDLKAKNFDFYAKRNRHLNWDIAEQLAMAAPMADLAAEILGPELLLWRTNFFVGQPGSGIRWHHDEYKKLLSDTVHQLSIHLAISASSEDNCIMLLPGSHAMTREELAAVGFNFIEGTADRMGGSNYWRDPAGSAKIVKMISAPGEFFAFHPRLIHASLDLTQHPDARPAAQAATKKQEMPRIGITLRITVPQNMVFPDAFIKALGDHAIRLR